MLLKWRTCDVCVYRADKRSIKRGLELQVSWPCLAGMVPSDTRQPWDMRGGAGKGLGRLTL